MQSLFNVTSIDTDYTNKQIIIKTTFSVEPKTVNKKNIEIVDASSGAAVIYKLSVDDDKIIVTLKNWPDLNENYYVVKIVNIKDKLNRDLIHPITKNVMFKADTKLKIIILNPNNNEAVVKQHNVVNFSIKQINPDGSETVKPIPDSEDTPTTLPNKETGNKEAMTEEELDVIYHFEFASDIAFFDIVKDYKTPYTEGFIQLDSGQYYMRARAIEGDMSGDWSSVHTFTVVPDACSEELDELSQAKKDYIDEIMAPVEFFLDEEELFEIISHSNNGVTYPEFYIEFSQDIDADRLPDSIIAYRRDL